MPRVRDPDGDITVPPIVSPQTAHKLAFRRLGARFALAWLVLVSSVASAQTFVPSRAIDIEKCGSKLGLFTECQSIESDVISRSFAESKLGKQLFAVTHSSATHCTKVSDADRQCQASLAVTTDPRWDRIIWSRSGSFIDAYGETGSGIGQFQAPAGVDVSRREGYSHAVFVADAGNNRVVALRVNYLTKTVDWLGEITGIESGKRMRSPQDVVWDASYTWATADDRLFILDSGNNRVLVYRIEGHLGGSFATQYLGAFGSTGSGTQQLMQPVSIAVHTYAWLSSRVYISDAGNQRIVAWKYEATSANAPAVAPTGTFQTPTSMNGRYAGLSVDHYGDVIAALPAANKVVKFTSALAPLKSFGGGATWASGRFLAPSDAAVINAHRLDASGAYQREGLPYLSVTERWGTNSGLQLQRLGVDADSLQVSAPVGSRTATLFFLMTAYGSVALEVRNSLNQLIRTWPMQVITPGWAAIYWDGRDSNGNLVPFGAYAATVKTISAYQGDEPETPLSTSIGVQLVPPSSPIAVAIDGPAAVDPGVSNTWQAVVQGGSGVYTYQWYRRFDTNWDTEQWAGDQSSLTYSTWGCYGLVIRVVVSSGGYSAEDTAFVSMNQPGPSGAPCLEVRADDSWNVPERAFLRQALRPSSGAAFGISRLNAAPDTSQRLLSERERVLVEGIRRLDWGVPRAATATGGLARRAGQARYSATGESGSGTAVRTRLAIYSISGRLVRVGVEESLDPGFYTYNWDGRDQSGRPAPPGVYVAILTLHGREHRSKLVLTR